ncbi:MAG: hypothetical protein PUD20_08705 [bacterium]|nr:hypothetical protein [bacterium]
MKKKNTLFTITFVTYIVAGAAAIFLFASNGSNLSHSQNDTTVVASVDSVDTIIPIESETPIQPIVPATPEEPPAEETPLVEETPPIEETPPSEEVIPEPPAEEINEEADDKETDDPIYYAFVVIDGVTNVRIRETENRSSAVLSHIDGGEKGYVLEQGKNRTKVLTEKGTIGYVFNAYITVSEIPKEDFPKEYR